MKKVLWSLFVVLFALLFITASSEAFEVEIIGQDSITVGKSAKLSVSFKPAQTDVAGKWETNDDKILKVDARGIITGVAAGEAYITFTSSADSSVYATHFMTVTPVIKESFQVKIIGANTIELGKSTQLSVSFDPAQTDTSGKWETNDDKILKVDARGIITGVAEGEAYITFTSNADSRVYTTHFVEVTPVIKNSFQVKITGIHTIGVGKSSQLSASFDPVQKDTSGVWETNDAQILKIDPRGIMTGATNGSAYITFTANANSDVFATHYMEVTGAPVSRDIGDIEKASGCNSGFAVTAMLILLAPLSGIFIRRRT